MVLHISRALRRKNSDMKTVQTVAALKVQLLQLQHRVRDVFIFVTRCIIQLEEPVSEHRHTVS